MPWCKWKLIGRHLPHKGNTKDGFSSNVEDLLECHGMKYGPWRQHASVPMTEGTADKEARITQTPWLADGHEWLLSPSGTSGSLHTCGICVQKKLAMCPSPAANLQVQGQPFLIAPIKVSHPLLQESSLHNSQGRQLQANSYWCLWIVWNITGLTFYKLN